MRVDFYHLDRALLERVLPSICDKLLGSGERLLIVADPALLDQLDGQLWSHAPELFLPHGRSGGVNEASQPILLSEAIEPANGAVNVALADGRWRDEALGFERVFYFFEGGRLEEARASWRRLSDRAGVERRYWKQDETGKWVEGP
jgi:DNA polymerase III subunit chi